MLAIKPDPAFKIPKKWFWHSTGRGGNDIAWHTEFPSFIEFIRMFRNVMRMEGFVSVIPMIVI